MELFERKRTKKNLDDRKKEFAEAVFMEGEGHYTNEMMRAFWEHWTQTNPNGWVMAFEREMDRKAFEIAGRLRTWNRNEKNGFARKKRSAPASDKKGFNASDVITDDLAEFLSR
jgi:hypothetical protein